MKYIKLYENFEEYDPYELMIMYPNQKAEMILDEFKKVKPNLNLMNDLIVLGANVNWQDDLSQGRTALHLAIYSNFSEIARMLIDAGADTDIQDNWGDTPLHIAIRKNNSIIAQMLLDAGARTDIQNHSGKVPFYYAETKELKNLLKP